MSYTYNENGNDDLILDHDTKPKSQFFLKLAAAAPTILKGIGLAIFILGALAAVIGTVGLAVPAVAAFTAGILGMAGTGAGVASMLSGAIIVGGALTASVGWNFFQAGRITELKRPSSFQNAYMN